MALRQVEEQALLSAFEAASQGQGRLVFLIGEPGMGKSHLASDTAARARTEGALVVEGRSWEAGDAPAYWLWAQVIRSLLDELGEDAFLRHSAEGAGQLTQIAAELRPLTGGLEVPDESGPPSRFDLFEAVSSMFRNLARDRPLVIVLKDIQFADEPSLHLLTFLARSLTRNSVLFLATCAEPSPNASRGGGGLGPVLDEGEKIILRGLDVEQVIRFHEEVIGSPCTLEMARELHEATEGNVLFLTEAIKELSVTGGLRRPDGSLGFMVPSGARALFKRRIAALPQEVVEVLELGSVVGREFDADLLSLVSQIPATDIVQRLDHALSAGLVAERGALGRYRFAHILIRETLYEGLPMADRMRAHSAVARQLEDRYGDDPGEHLGELAHHHFKAAQAGDFDKTLEYTWAAAERARKQTAYEEAARLYNRASQVAELAKALPGRRAQIRDRLATVEKEAGRSVAQETQALSMRSDRFVREGEFWTITHGENTFRIRDSRGARYLQLLLRNPGREMHSLDIVATTQQLPGATPDHMTLDRDGATVTLGDAGELLDAAAKAAYKQRLADLADELDEAQRFNDPERANRSQEEIDALVTELSAGVGLGGRDRKAASAAERARGSVSKALKATIKKIAEIDSDLGSHLIATVRTGYYCSYTPDPRAPYTWEL